MSGFISRPVVLYELPLVDSVSILHPEQVVLKFGNAGSLDIGALCYLNRDKNKRKSAKDCHLVDLNSFSQARANKVRALIEFISKQYSFSSKRPLTLIIRFRCFISHFMGWADSNSYTDVFDNETSAKISFRAYVADLKEKIAQNACSVNHASRLQEFALYVLEGLFEVDCLSRGTSLIRRDSNATETTPPPCEEKQSKVLALCMALFLGFSELVLENKLYPFCMRMPKYLGWAHNYLWVFPLKQWYALPHQTSTFDELKKYNRAFDYANGKLATFGEIKHFYAKAQNANESLQSAQKRLLSANKDHWDYARVQTAVYATNAFVQLFVANTGMNMAQIIDLAWTGDYECGVERQGFRAIKWRAAGRACQFEITAAFLPRFKRYLQLRDYLLNGRSFDHLFFTLGPHHVNAPKKISAPIIKSLNQTLCKIDPQLTKITSREWRAAKSDWLVRNTDPATAAIILQNSEKTVLNHYAAGSETKHVEEMGNFFDQVTETVVNKGQTIEHGLASALGVCSSTGSPHYIENNVPVPPDCRTPEGCLFCDKLKVHADERDTRKLLSCRYCLMQTAPLVSSQEQFQNLFVPIFDRIQQILDEISRRDGVMVEQIKNEVDEGELDPYWASKLEMLMDLELVA